VLRTAAQVLREAMLSDRVGLVLIERGGRNKLLLAIALIDQRRLMLNRSTTVDVMTAVLPMGRDLLRD